MSPAVAIFVKTPGYSPVKTRLAKELGRRMAEQWHQHSVSCVEASVMASGLTAYWAVAESAAMDDPMWKAFPQISQGSGSLGARMHAVHSALVHRHGAAILIGGDLPQLVPSQLQEAAGWLTDRQPRHVLGPARDGGFWLFGGNRAIEKARWCRVEYSRPDTAEHFVHSMDASGWHQLETLSDLDEAEQLKRVRWELGQLADPHRRQRHLMTWLDAAIATSATSAKVATAG